VQVQNIDCYNICLMSVKEDTLITYLSRIPVYTQPMSAYLDECEKVLTASRFKSTLTP